MTTKNQCKACGHETADGMCPACGYVELVFPAVIPEALKDFETKRLEHHRRIAAAVRGGSADKGANGPRVVVRNCDTGKLYQFPVVAGLNTYGSNPRMGAAHAIRIDGLALEETQFAVKWVETGLWIQPAPATKMYFKGRDIGEKGAVDAAFRSFDIPGAEIIVIF